LQSGWLVTLARSSNTLLRSARLSEFFSTRLATLSVLRSLFGLGLSGLPVRFSPCRAPEDFDILGFSSLSLSLLSRVLPLCCRCCRFLHQALWLQLPPLRFLPLRRFSTMGSYLLPKLPASGYDAFSAFLTLSRPFSTHCLPALFHAGSALGVLTLQGRFPLTERYAVSGALPSCGQRIFWPSPQAVSFRSVT